ncbi:MAG: RIP metalloprotease RseP [Candidatus Melainabacteria bacterium]|nr:RIP metalloprotease RseP [Candidatus Melainabacteria bacterium]
MQNRELCVIIVHEFGHWIVARKLGFQTPIFGFGLPFGPCIKLGRWKDTEFRFHWFVLGGYVAIPELGDETSEDLKKEVPDLKPLQSFPVWQRACVAAAGVTFNIIFAYLMCLIMVATIGPPSTEGKVVITQLLNTKSEASSYSVSPNQIAEKAGLKVGDAILEINGEQIATPSDVVSIVQANKLKALNLTIERIYVEQRKKKIDILSLNITPNAEGKIGVGLGLATGGEYDKPSRNPLVWCVQAARVLIDWTATMLITLGIMIMNLFGITPPGTPKIGADDVHGIIAIVSVFAQAITLDFREVFRWSALISVNLAIINLLPIPALDGGHLLFMFIEKLRGKKLAENIQQKAIQTGFFLLILLMFFVLFNDIKGLMTGKFDFLKEKEAIESKD